MNIQQKQYFYKIIPTLDAIDKADTNGRWYIEKFKSYIEELFKNYNYEFFWSTKESEQSRNLVVLDKKITDEIKKELTQLSPNIIIEFLFEKDGALSAINEKLEEALELSVKYGYFNLSRKIIDILDMS